MGSSPSSSNRTLAGKVRIMARTVVDVDMPTVMGKIPVTIHIKRLRWWSFRSHVGIAIVKVGLKICGFTVTTSVVDKAETEDAQ